MKIVERIPAHYEVQEVEDFGRSYRWCPEQIVLECDPRTVEPHNFYRHLLM
ncbi:MAG TPA: hypothetical protein VFE21_02550 [Rubrobacteraceae bacterium]|nr:hypothetical protein [Rubrobacteraceae bacterium]